MGKIQEIEALIRTLSEDEYDQLRNSFLQRDQEAWDMQIASDAKAGKLAALGEAARQAHASGNTTRL